MALADLQRVDPAQAVGQGGAQARYLVVLVVHPLLQVGHAVAQHFVLVFNHVITSRHTKKMTIQLILATKMLKTNIIKIK